MQNKAYNNYKRTLTKTGEMRETCLKNLAKSIAKQGNVKVEVILTHIKQQEQVKVSSRRINI